jgi:SEL1 protein
LINLAPKKDWSLSEWIANFIDDEMRYYEQYYDEDYEDTMPGGDSDIAGDVDDGIIDSLVLVGLGAALVFLLVYRQHRQAQAQARQEEENARRQGQQVPAAVGGVNNNPPAPPVQGQQPGPGNGNGLNGWEWIAGPGGVGH